MKLYTSQLSPFGARVRIGMQAKGLDFPIELPPAGSGSEELKKLSPLGKIPILIDGDLRLVESMIILEYLEAKFPDTPALLPKDPAAAARVRMAYATLDAYVIPAFLPVFKFVMGARSPEGELEIYKTVEGHLRRFEAVNEGVDQIGQGSLTLADCAVAPMALLIKNFANILECPDIAGPDTMFGRWYQTLQSNPHVRSVLQSQEQGLKGFFTRIGKEALAERIVYIA